VGRALLNTECGALSSEVGSHDPSDRASPLLETASDCGVAPLLKRVPEAATLVSLADAHECLEKAGLEGTAIKDYSQERSLKLLGSQPQPKMAGAQERNEPSSDSVGGLRLTSLETLPRSLQKGRGANKIPGEGHARYDRALLGSHQTRQMGGVEERTEERTEPEPEPEQELKPHQKQRQIDADTDLREFLRVCGEASTRYHRKKRSHFLSPKGVTESTATVQREAPILPMLTSSAYVYMYTCAPTHTHINTHTHKYTHAHRFLEIAQPFEDIPKYRPRVYPSNADNFVAPAALPATPVSPAAQVELNSRETTAMDLKQRSMLHLDAPVLHLDAPESFLALNLARSSVPNKSAEAKRNELERRLSEERASQLLECDVTRCVDLVTSLVSSQHPALAQRPQKHGQELRELKRNNDDELKRNNDNDSVYCSSLEISIEQAHAINSRESARARERESEREDLAGGKTSDNLKARRKGQKVAEDAHAHRRGRTPLGVDARVLDLLVSY
jgi:hypothetical protein